MSEQRPTEPPPKPADAGAFVGRPPRNQWPKGAPQPEPGDVVAVLMTEEMARRFEQRCLGRGNTVGDTHLAGPMLFREDDVPTYIIGVRDDSASPMRTEGAP
jgi:hypothetical protein